MTIPATTWWQYALSTVCWMLVLIGAAAVLTAMGVGKARGQPPGGRSAQVRILVGLVMALLGGAGLKLLPLRPRVEPEVITARKFSSTRLPALSVEVPEGWQLTHDAAAGKVEAKSAAAGLVIETSLTTEPVDGPFLVKGVADSQRERGYTVEPAFDDTIDGLAALAVSASNQTRSSCVWVIKRGDRLVSTIICASEVKARARDACRAVLSTLKWRAPGPL